VVLNNPAGNRAAEAQYYYAECLFQQKLYVEAELEYERLLRRWANTEHLVEARYRSVQCLVEQSPKYYHDQGITGEAVDELQQFIDDFPDSEYVDEAEKLIDELRFKIARKYYEAGRQYLKWEESESARLYFNRVLTLYYDTELADQARLGMVISFLIEEDSVGAQAYLEESLERFSSLKLLKEAENFIARAQEGKFDLAFYQRLYK
ncbi:MAG: outer membrane protein assembly factor BamD, partial [Candidatus Marinimicrobia bacterium]|nr:outer membrane protein assembly factor BamD [Candidatus Neomarinimicrobiota bacterium]